MKTLKLFSILTFLISLSLFSFAQEIKTETITVSGNCGMCKTRIEKAAKDAGAESADWDVDTKVLTVKYNSSSSDAAKIQQAIAAAGHDTRDFKATEKVYNKLPGCCKYERANETSMKCCNSEKCSKDKSACAGMDCCKEAKCCTQDEDHSKHGSNSSMMNCNMNGNTKKAS